MNDGGQNEVEETRREEEEEEKIRGQEAHKVTDAGRGTIFDKENWKNLQKRANLHRTRKEME